MFTCGVGNGGAKRDSPYGPGAYSTARVQIKRRIKTGGRTALSPKGVMPNSLSKGVHPKDRVLNLC